MSDNNNKKQKDITSIKQLAEHYNFNEEDVSFIHLKQSHADNNPLIIKEDAIHNLKINGKMSEIGFTINNWPYIEVQLKNGDWIDIYHPYYGRYITNNNSVRKTLTKKLHDLRESGVRQKEEQSK